MNRILDACLRSWPWDPWLTFTLLLSALIYLRGWRRLRRRDPERWVGRQPMAFLAGLASIFLALASPIEPFSFFFLQVHMLQHLLLMMAAPPLLWLGDPFFPVLRGLPRAFRSLWIAPVLRWPPINVAFTRLTHPAAALFVYVAVTWLWHVPALYDLALRSTNWHYVQHVSFLGSALVFWYPIVRPYPARPIWSQWLLVPFLILADVQNTVLSALLTFSSRVIYSHYDNVPRLGNVTALDDQATAGVLMWVPGSIAFLVPLFVVGLRLMSPAPTKSPPRRIPLTMAPRIDDRADLLKIPLLGRFLSWRHSRLALQLPLVLLAAIVAHDGFAGPQVGPANLAGVLPWIHWRGVLIVALLCVGNLFCMACPFMLPRTLARKLRLATRAWPRVLRSKWLAVFLLVSFFWAYEAFALWDSPWLTAWIIAAYFLTAFVVDAIFRGASFCKYVCPIGQFNFVQSLVSPFEIAVRDPAVCTACITKDCIRGSADVPGCELHLYQPRKVGNMDCTFCLDCVHACPHDNVGILATTPGAELRTDRVRSGLGRLSRRHDVIALVVVLVFGAFVNAGLMTGPVVACLDSLVDTWRTPPLVMTTLACVIGFIVVPALTITVAAAFRRTNERAIAVIGRYVYALVPLGFAMWVAHYGFHFLTSYQSALPTTQRFLVDRGWQFVGEPEWSCSCCMPAAAWIVRLEILALDLGLLVSLYAALRIARTRTTSWRGILGDMAPWAAMIIGLFAAGVWIVLQPMQMRGLMPG